MSSWFSDLAGKAENILNKIDQNAASVLKNDMSDRDQLLEVKISKNANDEAIDKQTKISNGSTPGRNIQTNSMKLPRTPKQILYSSTERTPLFSKVESTSLALKTISVIADDGNKLVIPSNASSSSRRSSCSSRTEGIQTVIEYPITKLSTEITTTNTNGEMMSIPTTSLSSLQCTTDDKSEMMAAKIVLSQMKVERDQMRSEIAELKSQLAVAQKEDLLSELTATCDQLVIDKENLQQQLQKLEDANNGYVKTISQLEINIAKMHEITMEQDEKLSMAKTETEQAEFELQQYRSRAQHTLQMKDQLISEMKSMHSKNVSIDDTGIDAQCKQIEYMTMKQERDSLLEELNKLQRQFKADKQIIITLENKIHETERHQNETEKSLTNALKQEKLKYSQLEEIIKTQTKELKVVREELKRQQTMTSTRLHEK